MQWRKILPCNRQAVTPSTGANHLKQPHTDQASNDNLRPCVILRLSTCYTSDLNQSLASRPDQATALAARHLRLFKTLQRAPLRWLMARECSASSAALHCCCSVERRAGEARAPADSASAENASDASSKARSSTSRSFACAPPLHAYQASIPTLDPTNSRV